MINDSGKSFVIACLLAAGLVFTLPAGAAGKPKSTTTFKCWTNKDGVRECGTSVPPEYSQEGHEVLNSQGTVIKETGRAKTPAELEEEARKKAAAEEAKRKEEEQKRQDHILLATFASVDDINRVRDEQLKALDATISVTNTRNQKIQQDLDKRIKEAAAQERSGKKPSPATLKDIDSLRGQIARNQEFIAAKEKEKQAITEEYAAKADRFTELKAEDQNP